MIAQLKDQTSLPIGNSLVAATGQLDYLANLKVELLHRSCHVANARA